MTASTLLGARPSCPPNRQTNARPTLKVARVPRIVHLIATLGVVTFLLACSSSRGSETDCPSYVVVVEGGATGFSEVGEWRSDELCGEYCKDGYPVCQLVDPSRVKCQAGCG
jgi:hypothetical protein